VSEFTFTDNVATASRVSVEEEQGREQMTTFKTWGTPEVRGKPGVTARSLPQTESQKLTGSRLQPLP
jgi:hypothetical protein